MNKKELTKASDRLENIDEKLECIANTIVSIDVDSCFFDDKSMLGFYRILKDLQQEVKDVKKLLD